MIVFGFLATILYPARSYLFLKKNTPYLCGLWRFCKCLLEMKIRDEKMVDLYKKYYLDDEKIRDILKNGIIVFDTSALLDLYYYSPETRTEIFEKAFRYLNGRLWMPAQVHFEYLKNKGKVAEKPIISYQRLLNKQNKDGGYVDIIVEKTKTLESQGLGEIKNQIKTLKEQTLGVEKHPYLSPEIYAEFDSALSILERSLIKFSRQADTFKLKMSDEIDKKIRELQDSILPDNVYTTIEQDFQIGKEVSFSRMMEIAKEGKFRYEEEIPPGYEDGKEKIGLQKYGDLFAWKQILEYASLKQKDFILVTNDLKPDWFEGDKKTPRFELLKEFHEQANKSIWLFSMKNFIYHINVLLDNRIHDTVLQDIDSVQDEKENDRIQINLNAENIQALFDNILLKSVYIIDLLPQNEAIRLFDNPCIFEAEDENGQKIRIMATLVNGGNYARVLHGMTNAFELKKFYERNNEHYWYYNLIIVKNKSIINKIMEHMGKTKVRKMYANKSVHTIVGYFNEDQNISIASANFDYGQ